MFSDPYYIVFIISLWHTPSRFWLVFLLSMFLTFFAAISFSFVILYGCLYRCLVGWHIDNYRVIIVRILTVILVYNSCISYCLFYICDLRAYYMFYGSTQLQNCSFGIIHKKNFQILWYELRVRFPTNTLHEPIEL